MKRSIKIFVIVLMMGIGYLVPQQTSASPFGVNFQVFYNELSPFGDWVMDPTHGYIWVPYVDAHFHPYATHGRWVMTSFGNTWVSDFAWGWAPFHYGRWFWSNFYGWAWVPGYEWGPAWVSWRSGGGFYGWAPLGPGLHVNVSFGIPNNHWVFIPQRRFRHRHFARYYVSHHRVTNVFHQTTIINNTTIVNNNTFYTGPSRREIERVTNSRVQVYNVQESNRPGRAVVRSNAVEIYRPQIQSDRNSRDVVRPATAYSQEEFRSRNATRAAAPSQGRAVAPANRGTEANGNSRNGQVRSAQTPSRANVPAGNSRGNEVNRASSGNNNPSRGSTVNTGGQNRNEGVRATSPASRNAATAPAVRNNSQNRSSSSAPAVRNAPARTSGNNQSSTVNRSQSTAPRASAPASSRSQSVKAPSNNQRSSGQVSTPRSTNNRSSSASKPNVAPNKNSRSSSAAKPSVAPSRSSSSSSGNKATSRSSSSSSSRNRGNN
ncbi:DUF6600 domain-containing protein [Mongoliitalea daihaiensis]|uniref:DUF6600 domain-containing protein n=1 Tax=Mongoliitalea daihaiensis TaxID=2782006 RepID=UPI001F19EBAC|nr:DUF6600 domain-containing protein [Mongoliitalea daihaiensis]UJP63261.1 hypothetical protein IPZ59_10375 [Mongoliitalea daihaiensis]